MQLSYWEKESFIKNIDALVIGSGLVGLSAAIHIKENHPEWHVVVAERGVLPTGASTKNAGFTCFGSVTEILDDLTTQPIEFVMETIEMRWNGLQKLQRRIGKQSMNYKNWGSYELFRDQDSQILAESLAQIDKLNHLIKPITGIPNVFSEQKEYCSTFGFNGIKSLIHNKGEGQIHTGMMMEALINIARKHNILILNGMDVISMDETGNRVDLHCRSGFSISAERVLIATNGFAHRLLPDVDVRPARNQVFITHPISGLSVKGCFHFDRGYIYFRNVDDRILIGGARNIDLDGETSDALKINPHIQDHLYSFLSDTILPGKDFKIDQKWTGILGVGQTKRPIIQQISARVYCAVRMGGMGVAIGSLVGEKGAEILLKN